VRFANALVGRQSGDPLQVSDAMLIALEAFAAHQLVQKCLVPQVGFDRLERQVLEQRCDRRQLQATQHEPQFRLTISHAPPHTIKQPIVDAQVQNRLAELRHALDSRWTREVAHRVKCGHHLLLEQQAVLVSERVPSGRQLELPLFSND
jgi:hypothetical protein